MIKLLLDVLRGVVIGVANIIPGVSGGTMMASMGIYDSIIDSINSLFKKFKKSILTLLPYGIGMLLGIVAFSFLIELLFDKFPLPTALLFIGLIFGGIPAMWKKVKGKVNWISVLLFVAFFSMIIVLQIIGKQNAVERELSLTFGGIVVAFLVGLIGAATMIIPGVSGSMVMLILGYYHSILGAINATISCLKAGDIGGMFGNILTLIPFAIGVLIGIFGVAKLIRMLLDKFEAYTFAAILGLVVASPYPVFSEAGPITVSAVAVIVGIVTFAVGAFGAYKLGSKE